MTEDEIKTLKKYLKIKNIPEIHINDICEVMRINFLNNILGEKELDLIIEKEWDKDDSLSSSCYSDWENAQDELSSAFEKGFKLGYNYGIGRTI